MGAGALASQEKSRRSPTRAPRPMPPSQAARASSSVVVAARRATVVDVVVAARARVEALAEEERGERDSQAMLGDRPLVDVDEKGDVEVEVAIPELGDHRQRRDRSAVLEVRAAHLLGEPNLSSTRL